MEGPPSHAENTDLYVAGCFTRVGCDPISVNVTGLDQKSFGVRWHIRFLAPVPGQTLPPSPLPCMKRYLKPNIADCRLIQYQRRYLILRVCVLACVVVCLGWTFPTPTTACSARAHSTAASRAR